MLSRDLFRTDPERIRAMLASRRADAPLDRLLEVDREWRSIVVRLDEARAARNTGSKEVGALFREGRKDEGEAKRAAMAALGEEIAALEGRSRELESELEALELSIPNLVHASVPEGADESANRVERSWGEPPAFDFEPRPHWELGTALGILDFERAAKIAGARFVVLAGAGAALERALISYMLDLQTRGNGYREVLPPYLVNSASLIGTGQLPKFGDDLFHIEGTDYYLVPTAEVPVTNLHRDETLEEGELPLRYCAFTPCFRAEAGSYGKDVRGLIRLHQFHKVELVEFATPESSCERLERLTADAESVLQGLGLPYRVVSLCSRRPRLLRGQDLRPRGLAAGPRHLPRDLVLLQLHRLPGPARPHPLPARRRQPPPAGPHPQRLRARGRPHRGRRPRELPAARRFGGGPGGAPSLPSRPRGHRAGRLRPILRPQLAPSPASAPAPASNFVPVPVPDTAPPASGSPPEPGFVPVHARSLRPRGRFAPILLRRSPRLLAAGGRGDQPSPAGGRRPQATAATATVAAVGRLPPLAISDLEHYFRRNVVPKSPKMARPQDAPSSYSPRLPGAGGEAGAEAGTGRGPIP